MSIFVLNVHETFHARLGNIFYFVRNKFKKLKCKRLQNGKPLLPYREFYVFVRTTHGARIVFD